MLRLSKKVEYGLLALQHMSARPETTVSAKEVAEHFDISYEFLAKTMQGLARQGFIRSIQGVRGGYVLARKPASFSVGDVIEALQGRPHIVECIDSGTECDCGVSEKCTLRSPMSIIQQRIDDILASTSIADLVAPVHTITLPVPQ